ncbi:uncharacterized protein LOC100649092 isoform X3 [Bombus terrestris]|uniref:Uncharacterized protein LOC100649092 isoform X3 n=1 Tax=Bombus terrestris TaxID=30195 RepID=A0A9C6SKE1_BOMTE|nr:uncharacterized protein LOC100649092 isoform X3 [Bombus terrestris]
MKILPSTIFFLIFLISLIFLGATDNVMNAMQNLYCNLGLKLDDSCPIDGGWTFWSPWGSCSGKCGFKGRRMRRRTCDNPVPLNNGAPCIGPTYQIENCQITGCMMNDYETVVNAHPIRKGELKIVKKFHKKLPALIELCFLADCTFSVVEKILGNNVMLYWNAMNCVKYDIGCPNSGGWSVWGVWSACTATCGKGQKYRTRICNSPTPSNFKLMCSGLAFEMKSCVGINCRKHSGSTWSNWNEWSTCSVKCGSGVQTRKRLCLETQNLQGTSCKGPSKDIKGCIINNCSINGMWSTWMVWSPCTSSCGIGTQLRNRMCTNPSPSGNGTSCVGSASEVRQCFTKPCINKLHEVVHFTEKSSLQYDKTGRPSRLLHVYLRFLPLSPFGMIIYRFEKDCKGLMCDFVKLFLQNGKIVLLSQITDCTLALIHETKLEIGQWHVILIAIYGTHGVLRIDDGFHEVTTFSCIPISYDLDHAMEVGGFQGQIQELTINFALVQLHTSKDNHGTKYVNLLSSSNNVQYLMGDDNEGFINIGLTDSVAVSCPESIEYWQIIIAIKIESMNGLIATIPGDFFNKYILLLLEEGKVKLKFYQGETSTAIESMEHVLIGEWFEIVIAHDGKNMYMQINGNEKRYVPLTLSKTIIMSGTDIFLGAIRDDMRGKICSNCVDIPQISFTLGYLNINGKEIDLISLPVLEISSNRFSSRTISISDYYEEIPLLLGQELKLSCVYDTIPLEKEHTFSKQTYVLWLIMDKLLKSYGNNNDFFNLKDDGRVSTVSIASYITRDTIENFYSCHIYHHRNKSNKDLGPTLFTFGITVMNKSEEFESTIWKQWNLICKVVIMCFIFLIIWCLLEIFQDARNGHGFYRLPQMLNINPTSTINFVLSKNGVTLLGSQQAANEVVSRILEDN